MIKICKNGGSLVIVLAMMLVCLTNIINGCSAEHIATNNRIRDFDGDWRFLKDSLTGPEQPAFDDSKWRVLDLPHDWSIEDLAQQIPGKTIGPFTRESEGPRNGESNGHVVGGTGWYRKSFTLGEADKGKSVKLYFEGSYMETDVWVNGVQVGSNKHGYTSFWFDITAHCKPTGEKNTVSVRVVNNGQNSRWYSGSGLYRHVKLIVTDPLHVDQWGVYITTPKVSEQEATIKLEADISNMKKETGELKVRTRLFDAENRTAGTAETTIEPVDGNGKIKIVQEIKVKSPAIWSTETPRLYKAEITVLLNGGLRDVTTADFGIRTIQFSAEKGFLLNGQPLKMKGGCVHHDNGILGAAAIDRAEERKVELLKANGFNAVRSSHYPPSEKFLEACDRLGLLVIDEAFDMWQKPKNKDDYHLFFDEWWERDISSMVLRDRNHPSIVLWSLGNEIQERADPSGVAIMQKFRTVISKLDTTRPHTLAVCEFWDNPGKKWPDTAPAFAAVDVGGYNYQWWQYEKDHTQFPQRIMMGTESVPIHAFENWQLVEKLPYVVGDFVWTAMDYLGESGIGHTSCEHEEGNQLKPWPWFNAWCGDIDLTGNKKPQSFYRDVVWRRSKIEMAVHTPLPDGCREKVSYWGWPNEEQSWTWPGNEGKKMEVRVYSRAPLVRLSLNGKIIGEKMVSDSTRLTAVFEVPYDPGELRAIAVENGKETASVVLRTAADPKTIRLKADRTLIRSHRNDLSYVVAEITDDKNNLVTNASMPLEFSVRGAGEIAAIGNANPSEMRSFKDPECTTFRGRCLVIIRPSGKAGDIVLEAKGKGLQPAKIVITTKDDVK